MEISGLKSILDNFPGIICVQDANYNIRYANKNFINFFGTYKHKPCYEVIKKLPHPCNVCKTYPKFAVKPVTYEINMYGKILELHEQPFWDSDGTPLILKVAFDITARKLAEQELLRLDRLSVIGEAAAGIAHEIRNPMTTVRGFLQIFAEKEELREYLDYIKLMISELDRANRIITQFLSLAANSHIELVDGNLNHIIEAIYPLINADAVESGKKIKLTLQPLHNIKLNENEIRQMILNICNNGLEAMEAGGILSISTYQDKNYVCLKISDEGKGISKDILSKLGTPFLTTKEKGTGLGLAVCYSIAKKHNAKIEINTDKNGTTFLVKFLYKK